jgi:type VI protein secretion system component Hcp
MRRTMVVFVAIMVTFAALFVALSATKAGATTSLYLDFSGITGGSTASGHVGWISIDSVSWGVSTASTTGKASKPSFTDLSWTQQVDKSIPSLFDYIAKGTHIGTAEVDFVDTIGGKPLTYFSMTFQTIFLTSLNLSGVSGGQPSVSGSFDYERIMMKYTAYNTDGGVVGTTQATYNLEGADTSAAAIASVYALGLSGPSISTVPIPAALWFLGPGLVGLAAIRRRFKK